MNSESKLATTCTNCGQPYGKHEAARKHCPKLDASASHEWPWRDTVFTIATAFGCFRDHPSHADAADQWQCIREHFAELMAKAEHWHTWERFGRAAQPALDAAVELRGYRAALDLAGSEGRSDDFKSQLRERQGIAGRMLDLAVDSYREAMSDD